MSFVLSSTSMSWLHPQTGFLSGKMAAGAVGLPLSDIWLKVASWGSPGSLEVSNKLCFCFIFHVGKNLVTRARK